MGIARRVDIAPRTGIDPCERSDFGYPALACIIQCAVTRCHSSAGANPAQQLSLQPVAVGADDGGNDIGFMPSPGLCGVGSAGRVRVGVRMDRYST